MGVRLEGDIKKLEAKLKKGVSLQTVKKTVRFHGARLNEQMVRNAEFTQGYQTGTTKRSIKLHITDEGLTAECGPSTSYAPYLEYGTRFMSAQPFVRPALDSTKGQFLADLKKLTR